MTKEELNELVSEYIVNQINTTLKRLNILYDTPHYVEVQSKMDVEVKKQRVEKGQKTIKALEEIKSSFENDPEFKLDNNQLTFVLLEGWQTAIHYQELKKFYNRNKPYYDEPRNQNNSQKTSGQFSYIPKQNSLGNRRIIRAKKSFGGKNED